MRICDLRKHKDELKKNFQLGMGTLIGFILSKCSSLTFIKSKKMDFIGRGSFGMVIGGVLKRKKKVAIKYIMIQNATIRKQTIKEVRFANLMAKKNIGPKVYDSFMVNLPKMDIVVIIMERFETDGAYISPSHSKNHTIIQRMMLLIRKMIHNKLYCFDIKPINFVLNRDPLEVKMIDFGGKFCYMDGKDKLHIKTKELKKLKKVWGSPIPIKKLQSIKIDDIFFNLVMLPFIWNIKKNGATKDTLSVFRPFLNKICPSRIMLLAMSLFIVQHPAHFQSGLYHYTSDINNHSPLRDDVLWRMEYLRDVLREICTELFDFKLPRRSRRTRRSHRHRRHRRSRRTRRTRRR